jgi:ligand-binding SRPBCC domain-containing protein
MVTLIVETPIHAPIKRCFDLARDISLHCATTSWTKERAVAGCTKGMIGMGDSVTFEGVHFGFRLRLTARIMEFESPYRFVDEMVRGPFKSLRHVHEFREDGGVTIMTDTLIWTSPLGIVGQLADFLFLRRHMKSFLIRRNAGLKAVAEKEQAKDGEFV